MAGYGAQPAPPSAFISGAVVTRGFGFTVALVTTAGYNTFIPQPAPAARTLAIGHEDRTFKVAHENRTLSVSK